MPRPDACQTSVMKPSAGTDRYPRAHVPQPADPHSPIQPPHVRHLGDARVGCTCAVARGGVAWAGVSQKIDNSVTPPGGRGYLAIGTTAK